MKAATRECLQTLEIQSFHIVLVPLTFEAPRLTPTSVSNMYHHWPATIFPGFFLAGMLALCAAPGSTIPEIPGGPAIDTKFHEIMTRTHRRLYAHRHTIENYFACIKRHRRTATRYEKLAVTFLAFVQFATVLDWLTQEV